MDTENKHQEVELLTRKFQDYIDKVQKMIELTPPVTSKEKESDGNGKLYTVVSPADAMAVNLQTVIRTIENAIKNIEEISGVAVEELNHSESTATVTGENLKETRRVFTKEELTFLEETFNRILRTSVEDGPNLLKLKNKSR